MSCYSLICFVAACFLTFLISFLLFLLSDYHSLITFFYLASPTSRMLVFLILLFWLSLSRKLRKYLWRHSVWVSIMLLLAHFARVKFGTLEWFCVTCPDWNAVYFIKRNSDMRLVILLPYPELYEKLLAPGEISWELL